MAQPALNNPDALITVGKAAEFCQVYRGTIQRWIALRKLKAHQLPSGHYRIRLGDLREFMLSNHMPVPPEMGSASRSRSRILIVDESEQNRARVRLALVGLDSDIEEAANWIDALLKIGDWKPSLVILNPGMAHLNSVQVLHRISAHPSSSSTRILVAGDGHDDSIKKKLNRNPSVVGYLNKPTPAAGLRKQVQEAMAKIEREGGKKD